MRCPKCQHENPETAQFCLRCHNPVRYVCPACHHAQDHGGKCDQCGIDFGKYATMMIFQNEQQVLQQRERMRSRSSMVKQLLLLPITGGWSLIKHLLSMGRE
jgi:Double zinc ribbon